MDTFWDLRLFSADFVPFFLHLVQELAPIFGESRNKFCNIFVTILPHLFCFGETSFYGGKKCRFSSFSGHGGGLFRRVLGSPTRGAVEPKARLRGCMGESPARETAAFGFGIQRFYLRRSSLFVQPLRHPFGMPPPLVGEALAGRCILGSPFGRAVERSETERARFSVSDLALSVTACAVPPPPKWEARAFVAALCVL